jgi:iron complex transport system ATP-binding protein
MFEVQSVSVSFDGHLVVSEVSLAVKPGDLLALIGPNGAGKTTLIRAISGVIPINAGHVKADGVDLLHLSTSQRARFLAVVPQARNLSQTFTVFQTVMLGRTPYLGWLGHSGSRDEELAKRSLEIVHLQELAERRVGDLSGGEQQRVLLARALTQGASILLLDEPTTHLDLQYQSLLLNIVKNLARERNLTVLMALHDLNLASIYADRVALLVNGRIIAEGLPLEVLTEQILTSVYHVPVQIISHPEYGIPLVLPDGVKPPSKLDYQK